MNPALPSPAPTVMAESDWQARAAAHKARVNRYAEPYLARRSAGKKHPVEDFLFTYYTQKPGQLSRWHPGAGVVLTGTAATERLAGSSTGPPARRNSRRPGHPRTVPASFLTRKSSWSSAGTRWTSPGSSWAAQPHARRSLAALGCMSGPWSTSRKPMRCGTNIWNYALVPAARTRWWRTTGSAARTLTRTAFTPRKQRVSMS